MKQNELTHIEYARATNLGSGEKGEITERYIIPTFVPQDNIKALDVTDLTDDERAKQLALWEEYQEYYKNAVASLFDFATWAEHSGHELTPPKWRTFKKANITLLD